MSRHGIAFDIIHNEMFKIHKHDINDTTDYVYYTEDDLKTAIRNIREKLKLEAPTLSMDYVFERFLLYLQHNY